MSYTLTITFDSLQDMENHLAALRHTADPAATAQVEAAVTEAGVQTAPEPEAEAPKPRRGRPPREKAEPVVQEKPASTENGQAEKVNEPTLDDVKAALRGVQQRAGEDDMATPIGILREFNATRVSEVKAEDYAGFIAACDKVG